LTPREAIGVDLGGTKMAVGVVDAEQQIHYEGTEPSIGLTENELLVDLGRELEEAKQARPDVVSAGLGIPATIDHDRGVAIQAVNLEISDVPLRDLMAKQLGLPVFIDNDANVAALAEFLYGAGRGARNVVMLTIGTGIGGGLILDGEIYRGTTGAGAELGHIVIVEDGLP
jgi:glucokinase